MKNKPHGNHADIMFEENTYTTINHRKCMCHASMFDFIKKQSTQKPRKLNCIEKAIKDLILRKETVTSKI